MLFSTRLFAPLYKEQARRILPSPADPFVLALFCLIIYLA